MKIKFVFIFILLFLSAFNLLKGQNTLSIIGEVSDSFGAIEGSLITVEADSTKIATHRSNKKGEFYFELNFGEKYRVSFSKDGYSSKQIIINTKLPEERNSDIQQLLTLKLELIEKLTDSESKTEPLGVVSYSRITKEFSYSSKFDDNKFTNIEVAGTDYYLSERKNLGIPRKKVEDINEKIKYNGIDISERKASFFNKVLDKRSSLLAEDNSYDNASPEKQKLVNEMPMDTAISYYSSFNMDITEILLNNRKILRVYHRVEHDWGGVFYFKNYRAISKTLFYLETEIDKKKVKSNTSLHSAYKSN
jgi:hypothetical protein